jgi:hypothetical protein
MIFLLELFIIIIIQSYNRALFVFFHLNYDIQNQESKKADIQITTDAGVERINGCDALLMCPLKSNETSRLEYKMSSKMTAKIVSQLYIPYNMF